MEVIKDVDFINTLGLTIIKLLQCTVVLVSSFKGLKVVQTVRLMRFRDYSTDGFTVCDYSY